MAMRLDGTNAMYSNVNLASFDALITNQIALVGWMLPTGVSVGGSCMTSRQDNATIFETMLAGYNIVTANKLIGIFNAGAGPQQLLESVANITQGIWTHFVCQYNGNKASNRVELYINGVLDTQGTTLSGNVVASNREIAIGFNNDAAGIAQALGFVGSLEDIRYYNRALSEAEIMTIYTGKGKDGIVSGLIGRWQCNKLGEGVAISLPETDLSDGNRAMNNTTAAGIVYVAGTQVARTKQGSNSTGRM